MYSKPKDISPDHMDMRSSSASRLGIPTMRVPPIRTSKTEMLVLFCFDAIGEKALLAGRIL